MTIFANIQPKSDDCAMYPRISARFLYTGIQIFRKKKERKRGEKEREREYHERKGNREDSWRSTPPFQALRRRIFWNGKVTDSYVINFPPARVQLRENQMSQWPRTFRSYRIIQTVASGRWNQWKPPLFVARIPCRDHESFWLSHFSVGSARREGCILHLARPWPCSSCVKSEKKKKRELKICGCTSKNLNAKIYEIKRYENPSSIFYTI